MALTAFQRDVCRLLAVNRLSSGESYVAGGTALNELLRAPRLSRDIDLFHDTAEALAASWTADRELLQREGGLDFEGEAPDAAGLARQWRAVLQAAHEVVSLLPAEESGRAVLTREGLPYRGTPAALREAGARGELLYHEGRIRGAFPRIVR